MFEPHMYMWVAFFYIAGQIGKTTNLTLPMNILNVLINSIWRPIYNLHNDSPHEVTLHRNQNL